MAKGGGEVIVAEPCFNHVREFFKAKEIIDPESATGEKYHLIDLRAAVNNANRVKLSADAMKMRSKFSSEVLSRIQPMLEKCIP